MTSFKNKMIRKNIPKNKLCLNFRFLYVTMQLEYDISLKKERDRIGYGKL